MPFSMRAWGLVGVLLQAVGGQDVFLPVRQVSAPNISAPPAPDCHPVGGWPKFQSHSQLADDNWGKYFIAVYGEIPDSGYPICLSDFWILFDEEVQKAGARLPAYRTCPRDGTSKSKGDYYSASEGQGLELPNTKAIFHPPRRQPLPSNAWVEVSHKSFPEDEHYGAWFYYAKGSGMWYNTGKTTWFNDHMDGYKHYGTTNAPCPARLLKFHDPCLQEHANNEAMSQACVAAGDDSIQFLKHVDGGTCGSCCHQNNEQTSSRESWSIEIVACKMKGIHACAAAQGDTTLKAGWMGKRNCECQENGANGFLNCRNVPKR